MAMTKKVHKEQAGLRPWEGRGVVAWGLLGGAGVHSNPCMLRGDASLIEATHKV